MSNKVKTRKSVASRFKVTANGKVLRRIGFSRHLRRNKSKAQLRRYKTGVVVTGKTARKVRRLLGHV